MSGWTWQTWEAIRRADTRRTRAFSAAVDALVTQPDLGAARTAYNQIMDDAYRRWKDDCTNAIALSEEEPF